MQATLKYSCALLILFALSFTFSAKTYAQRGEALIWQTNNASTSEVSIFLKNTGSVPFRLGFASFVINYNFSAMNTPVEIGEGLWDNNNNASYDDQTVAEYNGSRSASIEIGLAGPVQGITVPADSALAGTMSFTILIPTLNHNIQWNNIYTSVFDDNGNDITDSITFVDPSNSLLPVELISFTGNVMSNDVHLLWSTSFERNNSGFEIQRSAEGSIAWQSPGFVQGSINSNEIRNYEFIDRGLDAGSYRYRLKQTDLNGNFEFFELAGTISISPPNDFRLVQNFPNPFNPVTTIRYDLPVDSKVRLVLSDVHGKEVKILVNAQQSAGSYSVVFNVSDLSSGVYFYKLETPVYSAIRSMMLIK